MIILKGLLEIEYINHFNLIYIDVFIQDYFENQIIKLFYFIKKENNKN